MNKIKPFKFWCQTVLPLVYDESLSYYELLCKVVKYINDMIVNQSETVKAFEELKTYVETYLDELAVPEAVNERLDEMSESGELTELVVNHIQPNLILIQGAEEIYPLSALKTEDALYTLQGGCRNTNLNYNVFIFQNKSVTVDNIIIITASDNNIQLTKKIFTYSEGSANSITFDSENNVYYMLLTANNRIIKFDTNFNVLDEIYINQLPGFISIEYDDNHLYCVTSSHVVFKYNLSNNTYKQICEIIDEPEYPYTNDNNYWQDSGLYKNNLLQLRWIYRSVYYSIARIYIINLQSNTYNFVDIETVPPSNETECFIINNNSIKLYGYYGTSLSVINLIENGITIKNNLKFIENPNITYSNLNDIPLNTCGRFLLDESLRPDANSSGYNYIYYGSNTYRNLIVTLPATGKTYMRSYNGSWHGWQRMDGCVMSQSNITNLNALPYGNGYVVLDSAIRPNPSYGGYIFNCFGYNTKRCVICIVPSNMRTFINVENNGTWLGWKELTLT